MAEVTLLSVRRCCRHILLTLPPLSCGSIPTRFLLLFHFALLVSHYFRTSRRVHVALHANLCLRIAVVTRYVDTTSCLFCELTATVRMPHLYEFHIGIHYANFAKQARNFYELVSWKSYFILKRKRIFKRFFCIVFSRLG